MVETLQVVTPDNLAIEFDLLAAPTRLGSPDQVVRNGAVQTERNKTHYSRTRPRKH